MNGSQESLMLEDAPTVNHITSIEKENEEWRTVKDFPDYAVSNLGRVKRIKKAKSYPEGMILSPAEEKRLLKNGKKKGYLFVRLTNGKTIKIKKIHSLVLEAFVNPRPEGYECNHKDGVKSNNKLDNLEWVTRSENVIHSYVNKLKEGKRGELSHLCKLKESDAKEIIDLCRSKIMTQVAISKIYGVSTSEISEIKTHKKWPHLATDEFKVVAL
jgi:hypothetical protein